VNQIWMRYPMRWGILALLGSVAWGISLVTYAQDASESESDEFYEDYEELWDTGEYVRALSALERIIDEQARRYDKWIYRRAKLRFHVGRVDEAIEDMESISQSSAQPWYFLETAAYSPTRYKVPPVAQPYLRVPLPPSQVLVQLDDLRLF